MRRESGRLPRILVAAPLLVFSRPLVVMLWALPLSRRQALGQAGASRLVATAWSWLSAPVPATVIQATALWLWHAPALFDRALASERWRAAQHLSFIVSALVFWSAMMGRRGGQASAGAGWALAALCPFATPVVSSALGALMAFATSPWSAGYARLGIAPYGLTSTEVSSSPGYSCGCRAGSCMPSRRWCWCGRCWRRRGHDRKWPDPLVCASRWCCSAWRRWRRWRRRYRCS